MYAISYSTKSRHISARKLVPQGVAQPPPRTYTCDSDSCIRTNHAKVLIPPMIPSDNPQFHIVRSVAPWDVISLPLCDRNNIRSVGPTGIIGDRVYMPVKATTDTNIVSLWDVTTRNKYIPLYKNHVKGVGLDLRSADWRGQTWLSAPTSWYGEQLEESRELCTIVHMDTGADGIHTPEIATGDGGRLYGNTYYGNSQRGNIISALDPRESNVAEDIYSDGLFYSLRDFRDIPNGIAMMPIGDVEYETYCITIFDCRASAMIGTDLVISEHDHLFCVGRRYVNTIEIRGPTYTHEDIKNNKYVITKNAHVRGRNQ